MKNKNIVEAILESINDRYSKKIDKFKSLSSFKEIDEDMIVELIDGIGSDAYDFDDEEAFEDLSAKIKDWASLPNPVKLYRVVGVEDAKMIRTDDLGRHWTQYDWNLDGDLLGSIGVDDWDDDVIPYVVEAYVDVSEIDVLQTIVQNLHYPNEHEITLKNNGKNAKFITAYELD